MSYNKVVYLCGPINGCTDAEAMDWREQSKRLLTGIKFGYLDPMARDYRGRELEPGIAAEIVENDKNDIAGCGALLVYYEKPSVGTAMEVLYAWQARIPVVVVDKSGKPLSPWLIYHSDKVVNSLEEAVAYIRNL
jgi:nucleoside 2-deoxyribosyltransferase